MWQIWPRWGILFFSPQFPKAVTTKKVFLQSWRSSAWVKIKYSSSSLVKNGNWWMMCYVWYKVTTPLSALLWFCDLHSQCGQVWTRISSFSFYFLSCTTLKPYYSLYCFFINFQTKWLHLYFDVGFLISLKNCQYILEN